MLPAWSQWTLNAHACDRRDRLYSIETMRAGATGDRAWDALQLSLVATGELHNNARMGWGKRILAVRTLVSPPPPNASSGDISDRLLVLRSGRTGRRRRWRSCWI